LVKVLICTMLKIRLELVTYKKSRGLGEEAFGLPPRLLAINEHSLANAPQEIQSIPGGSVLQRLRMGKGFSESFALGQKTPAQIGCFEPSGS